MCKGLQPHLSGLPRQTRWLWTPFRAGDSQSWKQEAGHSPASLAWPVLAPGVAAQQAKMETWKIKLKHILWMSDFINECSKVVPNIISKLFLQVTYVLGLLQKLVLPILFPCKILISNYAIVSVLAEILIDHLVPCKADIKNSWGNQQIIKIP